MDYDKETQTKLKADKSMAREQGFYEQMPFCAVADVSRFVNRECRFLLELTPPACWR